MSGGYCYGDPEPVGTCGCCGGEARADFVDIGVGMVQASPYTCMVCFAGEARQDGNGGWVSGWEPPQNPSERGESVTGYYVNDHGAVFEMTFDQGHEEFARRIGTTQGGLRARGWTRLTALEGLAIDLPPFMPKKARSSFRHLLARLADDADGSHESWSFPYVSPPEGRGRTMDHRELMAEVSRLPSNPAETTVADLQAGTMR